MNLQQENAILKAKLAHANERIEAYQQQIQVLTAKLRAHELIYWAKQQHKSPQLPGFLDSSRAKEAR